VLDYFDLTLFGRTFRAIFLFILFITLFFEVVADLIDVIIHVLVVVQLVQPSHLLAAETPLLLVMVLR
jgi:hypothetical protein